MESVADGSVALTFRYKTNNPNANSMLFNSGAVSGVTVTAGGSGYTSAPTVAFVGGDGNGATATAQIDNTGVVTNVVVVKGGYGYDIAPVVAFTGGGGSGAAATASIPAGGIGVLATLTNATPVGTWTLTFLNDTNVTMTAPSGNTTNFWLPENSAQLFADPLLAYFGVQANNTAAIGQESVLSEVKVTGAANPLDDVFGDDSGLDSTLWSVIAADGNAVAVLPTNSLYWVQWSLPAIGYSLIGTTNLAAVSSWNNVVGTSAQHGAVEQTLITTANVPGANTSFYRLIKRQLSQLQVLFPGETNAPNTLTGKTGTPTASSPFTEVDVTFNAVDSTYHIVNAADTLNLTTSDSSAIVNTPNPALVGGTVTVPVFFGTAGSWTVTAADTSNTNITSSTSSAISIQ